MKTNTKLRFMLAFLLFSLTGMYTYATRYVIQVQNFSFTPDSIGTVKIGDTIHWEWVGGSHTTTSTSIPFGATAWDHPLDAANTGFDYVPALVGVYHYKCTPHESMGMVATFTVISANSVAGIPPVSGILIYPNPFVDNITFRVTTTDDIYIKDLKVYDITGKVIREVTYVTRPDFPEKTVNLSDLPVGLMFFVFMDNYDRIYTHRVIRQ
jgi:plastocyanin